MEITFKTIMVSYFVAILCILLGFVFLSVSATLSNILMAIGGSLFVAAATVSLLFLIAAVILE